ncbi:tetraacyldisaccharide 4'-kinase [Arcobacter sp. FWKO B]|uniref:tetraacyldisaccharide 4'-kinase n=1 Tax=Arcobacter sp. FWKO B TaxID=2593672 RepID=UPI0018A34B71|nr:tetraacyldisaccharide 4'-kinase [Arcobacter sp. FWKO B]QOG12648.1 tetraacyldisaccharide 4'-kinase [Arcobacter sp. FWKO B]
MGLKQKLALWVEEYLFYPTPLQQIISALLLPFTLIYCLIKFVNKSLKNPKYYGIKVVSIGNLLVGGTGKTPFTIALTKYFPNSAVVLRGYKRKSKGLIVVSRNGEILVNVDKSGDEAMLLAQKCTDAIIIVSEDRVKGILKAKELGASVVFLDDGYSKTDLYKFDILLRPKNEPTNIFCLPSGGYKEPKIEYFNADITAMEDKDFQRTVSYSYYDSAQEKFTTIDVLPKEIVFVSGISKPKRVLEFLPSDIKYEFFEDHYDFTQKDIEDIVEKYGTQNLIVTQKDFVKLKRFGISLYIIDLEIKINQEIIDKVGEYLVDG